MPQSHPELVLVGGGHAHVEVLRAFADAPPPASVSVVLDRTDAVYSGMVPGFVAGQYDLGELTVDVAALAARAGAEVVPQAATAVDPDGRRIALANGAVLSYDIASFDIGATVAGLDTPGVRRHALPTRPIGDFVHGFEAALVRVATEGGAGPDVVIVGGGAAGIELAYTLEWRLASTRLIRGRIRGGAKGRVSVVEAESRVLPGYPERLARRVESRARMRGITFRCGSGVQSLSAEAVTLGDGSQLESSLTLWVTGAHGHPLFTAAGLDTDARGFVHVRSTLETPSHPSLFAAGDCAHLVDFPQTPKAGVYAVRQGPVLERNLRARLQGRPLETYRPQPDFLTLLNLGDGSAIGTKWGWVFEGRWVMWMKDRIDRRWMRRYRPGR